MNLPLNLICSINSGINMQSGWGGHALSFGRAFQRHRLSFNKVSFLVYLDHKLVRIRIKLKVLGY